MTSNRARFSRTNHDASASCSAAVTVANALLTPQEQRRAPAETAGPRPDGGPVLRHQGVGGGHHHPRRGVRRRQLPHRRGVAAADQETGDHHLFIAPITFTCSVLLNTSMHSCCTKWISLQIKTCFSHLSVGQTWGVPALSAPITQYSSTYWETLYYIARYLPLWADGHDRSSTLESQD